MNTLKTKNADVAAVAAIAFAFFAVVARYRIVDDDEGFYALAGRALVDGQVPCRDFFFPQMPLGAALYGVVQSIFGHGIVPLRWVAAVCAALTTLLVQHAARRVGGRGAGIAAAALFASHTLVWEWATTAKTFPLGLLLGTAALVVATSNVVTSKTAVLAGFLAGAAVASRALSLPIAVAVIFGLSLRRGNGAAARTRPALGVVGFVVGLAPAILVASFDPRAFWFDNVTYHALRSPGSGLVKDVGQKLDAARAVFLTPYGAWRPDVTGIQTTSLFVAGMLAVIGARRLRTGNALLSPFLVATVLVTLVSFLPSPVWVQYFAAAIAPASVLAGCWIAAPGRPPWVVVATLGVFAGISLPSFRDRLFEQPAAMRPANVDRVGVALDRFTVDGEAVAAHWPGYLAASRRKPLPAAQNQFARLFSDEVPEALRRRYHLFTEAEFREALLRGEARAFVVGAFVVPETARAAAAAGFVKADTFPGGAIWLAPPLIAGSAPGQR